MPFDGVATSFNYLAKFDEVIDLLETPNHWAKHTYRNRDGQYCLLGALNIVGVTKLFEPVILQSISEMVEDKEFCCIESLRYCTGLVDISQADVQLIHSGRDTALSLSGGTPPDRFLADRFLADRFLAKIFRLTTGLLHP
jgi:hypothetical protein